MEDDSVVEPREVDAVVVVEETIVGVVIVVDSVVEPREVDAVVVVEETSVGVVSVIVEDVTVESTVINTSVVVDGLVDVVVVEATIVGSPKIDNVNIVVDGAIGVVEEPSVDVVIGEASLVVSSSAIFVEGIVVVDKDPMAAVMVEIIWLPEEVVSEVSVPIDFVIRK
jgi:hypothetical protein